MYTIVITRQSIPPSSLFNIPCHECTNVWTVFACKTQTQGLFKGQHVVLCC